jgi:hypothetical protein
MPGTGTTVVPACQCIRPAAALQQLVAQACWAWVMLESHATVLPHWCCSTTGCVAINWHGIFWAVHAAGPTCSEGISPISSGSMGAGLFQNSLSSTLSRARSQSWPAATTSARRQDRQDQMMAWAVGCCTCTARAACMWLYRLGVLRGFLCWLSVMEQVLLQDSHALQCSK